MKTKTTKAKPSKKAAGKNPSQQPHKKAVANGQAPEGFSKEELEKKFLEVFQIEIQKVMADKEVLKTIEDQILAPIRNDAVAKFREELERQEQEKREIEHRKSLNRSWEEIQAEIKKDIKEDAKRQRDLAKANLSKNVKLLRDLLGTEVKEKQADGTYKTTKKIPYPQSDVAKESGLSRATIIQIEKGKSDPSLDTLYRLASAFHIHPFLLLMGQRELLALKELFARDPESVSIDKDKLDAIRKYLEFGLEAQTVEAAKIAAQEMWAFGQNDYGTIFGAAIGTIQLRDVGERDRGEGTIIGALFGQFLSKRVNTIGSRKTY